MAASAPHTILLRGDPDASEEAVAATGAAIKPGMLLELTTAGTYQKHATAGGPGSKIFAREMDIAGGSIDDTYEDGDTVLAWNCRQGHRVYAWLAAGNDVGIGALLESNGDGSLRALNDAEAARASLTIGTSNAAVTFRAVAPGPEGNDIQIQYLAATAATATVTVTGNLIQIKPDSTTPGTTDQANDIVTLVNGDAQASALVTAIAGGTGASAVTTPVAATNLTGGAATSGHVIAKALEAVDNDPGSGGAATRIKVEVL